MSLASWMNQVINVASVTGSPDSYGKATYAAAREVRARVEQKTQTVFNAEGERCQSKHIIYTLEPMSLTDRIWLPGVTPSAAEGSFMPLTVTRSGDKSGARNLYKVEL